MIKKKKQLLAPIHPGEILYEEFLQPMGISMNRLAREIGVPAGRISQIVNGKRSISADTALRLGKFFGVSPELWLGMQLEYDMRIARRTIQDQLATIKQTKVA
jgi:addiction module HigA family antidote